MTEPGYPLEFEPAGPTRRSIAISVEELADLRARLAAAQATIAELRAALERALTGLQCWQKDQEEWHPESVDGWMLIEEAKAALATPAPLAADVLAEVMKDDTRGE